MAKATREIIFTTQFDEETELRRIQRLYPYETSVMIASVLSDWVNEHNRKWRDKVKSVLDVSLGTELL